ncbi:hypothetical protein EIN_173860 [Entamoeba invadens IP1]|uniref:Uncharacterized protein n=1 Tax=Entamoeba invadens IP1 TaxID=370355 RepID=A0A0A1TW54_ENTIV|nr:hypothetical protein EIN_173860 [Entamoeba invadens IP1]ELP84711.1 hypothetical protein EIN_173860 [Entamoeba invadens IP1]|eukprot:XP_004184057.1 hypothetical protein EIN_173860 [Entamoeba invadens IP1]
MSLSYNPITINKSAKSFVPKSKKDAAPKHSTIQPPKGFPPQYLEAFNQADDQTKRSIIEQYNTIVQENAEHEMPTREELLSYEDHTSHDDASDVYDINGLATEIEIDDFKKSMNKLPDKLPAMDFFIAKGFASKLSDTFNILIQPLSVVEASKKVDNQRIEELNVLFLAYLVNKYPDQYKTLAPSKQ